MNEVLSLVTGALHIFKNDFVLGVSASLVAAALFPVIADFLGALLAKLFGWLPVQGKTDLSNCTWRSVWHVESQRFSPQVIDEAVRIRQLGNRVFMKFKNGSLDFQARGVIDSGRFVTGTWRDKVEGGYHGAFQLIIDPVTRNMSGRWVGYSTQGFVKENLWVWTRNDV